MEEEIPDGCSFGAWCCYYCRKADCPIWKRTEGFLGL